MPKTGASQNPLALALPSSKTDCNLESSCKQKLSRYLWSKLPYLAAIAVAPLALIGNNALAQVVPDSTLGRENSAVVQDDINGIQSDRITGGATRGQLLFHSFREFNIEAGRAAYFDNPSGIDNIFARVTGATASNLFGKLGVLGEANLFLINPNGIVFGPNASLDVGGSFLASTANTVIFADGGIEYSATNPTAPPLLTINQPLGLQVGPNPEPIRVLGNGNNLSFDLDTIATVRDSRPAGLEVPLGKTLALVGGDLIFDGGNITARAGQIELGSVRDGVAMVTPNNETWGFSYDGVNNFGDIRLSQAASADASGSGGGNIQVRSNRLLL